MIQQPTSYAPVQQAAVQHLPQAPAEFNAIKINILGANVAAPAQQTVPMPVPQPEQAPAQETAPMQAPQSEQALAQPQAPEGQQLNYIA